MTVMTRAAAVVVVAATALAACSPGGVATPSPGALASPRAPSVVAPQSASPEPSPSGVPSIIGAPDPLPAGTYRMAPKDGLPKPNVTVTDGWSDFGGWALTKPTGPNDEIGLAVTLWAVDQVYGHPCQWNGTLFDPGSSVEDLARALHAVPLREASEPIEVSLDGHRGRYLEWSVPADIDFATCDADGVTHYFESWTAVGGGDRYQQGPGQVDWIWILDVDGTRVVIDAFHAPDASDENRAELRAIVESLDFPG